MVWGHHKGDVKLPTVQIWRLRFWSNFKRDPFSWDPTVEGSSGENVSYLYRKSIAEPFLHKGFLLQLEVPNDPGSLSYRRAVIFGSVATLIISRYRADSGTWLKLNMYLIFNHLQQKETRGRAYPRWGEEGCTVMARISIYKLSPVLKVSVSNIATSER